MGSARSQCKGMCWAAQKNSFWQGCMYVSLAFPSNYLFYTKKGTLEIQSWSFAAFPQL